MPWQLRRDLCQDMWWLHVNVPPMCHLSFYSELISQRCASFLGFALTQMKTCRRCTGTQQQHTSNICHKIRLSLFIPTAEEQEIISVCSGDTPPPPQPWNLQQGFQTESGKWYYAKIKYVVTPAQTLNWGSGERTRAACRGTGGKVRAPWRKLCSLMLFWLIYWDFLWVFFGFFLLEGGGGLSSNFTTLRELSVKAQQLQSLYRCLKHLTKHSSMGPLTRAGLDREPAGPHHPAQC